MNTPGIHYYFWMNSDWAYLGADRLEAITHKHGIPIHYKPVDLPQVYARTGGVLLGQRSPERQAYRIAELQRWCRKLGIHVNPTPRFMCPDATLASTLVIAIDRAGLPVLDLYKAILRAQWCEEQNIADPAQLARILQACQLDAEYWLQQAPLMQKQYQAHTEEAIAAGVFGSPTYVYQGELFWGQDRLDMLDETITLDLAPA
ncbi:2-hydroxychromene-2-carboxylate isomerase [Alcaligenes faecalis]|uniref:2-hydroxychromene-2-carboxylate isomerase n=1 Tax=Alcaligenes faecalis TaxID=511 RepID=UPI0005A783CD|nr:2-hydroxychromene-2-carboxylate isomerase [Alcaligenes faecalis]ATH98494.1 2-hydroxychromene-2-carboxylate isomerase [Alcaligenes faecalis]AYZ91281.1 2-hydroxychromene-2-carboxylate isomerase [Alcaligenes faecalis]MCX5594564.1 2-hydroxychromene-2-carboxylate isomerase [Alcaligenes faecalis]QQC32912.1 2-hydroxychromene-2-carboxylate isomerase [Alcaligenes faecalis]CAJ0893399.1 2-hydroxychromene-2-carboxylate isomerase [Alcaligenes faecalis subsp. faecalis]